MKKKPVLVNGVVGPLSTEDSQDVAKWHIPQNTEAVVEGSRPFFKNVKGLILMPIQTLKGTITRSFGYRMQEHEWDHLLEYLGAKVVGLSWNGSVYVPATLRSFVDRYFGQVT
jgi:hypothetical protein